MWGSMRHHTKREFALRKSLGFVPRQKFAGAPCAALLICVALAGCAGNSEYPNAGSITDLGKILTPEEQKNTVSDLQKSGQNTSPSAGKN